MTSLETRLSGKSDLEKEKDNETIKNRKLAKLAEKYKKEVQEAHFEIRDLKSRLLESSDIKVNILSDNLIFVSDMLFYGRKELRK